MESVFYYPVTLHQGASTGSVVAPWVSELTSPVGAPPNPPVVILAQSNHQPDGMYLWNNVQWKLVIPYMDLVNAIIARSTIELFYLMTQNYATPSGANIWKNSVLSPLATEVTAGTSSVWAIAYATAGSGTVTSVNNIGPDGSGNVPIGINNIPGLATALANAGSVKTVDGQSPDGNGNIVIQAQDNNPATGTSLIADGGATTGLLKLKTLVSGSNITLTLDGNGNIVVASSGSGGGGVSSFNTRTGVVTLSLADVTSAGGAPTASPALTGTPTAPTPNTGDNSTNIATTAYVLNAIGSGAQGLVAVFEFIATAGETSFPATFSSGATVEVYVNGGLQLSSTYNLNGTGPVVLNTPTEATDEVKIIAITPFTAANTVPTNGGTFTGNVFGVTASPGDNSTLFATTAFVTAAIATVSGVASFNTRTGAVTLQASDVTGVGGALLASPTFTGVPAGPTASPGTNTTQLATTAFVAAAVAAGGGGVTTFNTRSGAVTLQASDVTGVGGALLASPTFTGIPAAPTASGGTNTTQIATTAFVTSAVSTAVTGLATLASPTFTGTPAAPTATAGTNTTQIATTAFVVASYAPLASPALTGVPTAPTAAPATNTTQIATTAFVTAAVAAGTAGVASFNTRTGAVTLQASDVTGVGGALLASPALTGTPTAPTAAGGTNNTQIASTAYVYSATQGETTIALTNANVTLSAAQYSNPIIKLTGTLTGAVQLTVPTTGQWSFYNTTTGAFAVTLTNGTAATLVVPQSTTSVVEVISDSTSGIIAQGVTSVAGRTGAVVLAVADVSGAAPLASPTFTGTPAAPTATAGTNTTQLATTAFVTTAVAAGGGGVTTFNTRSGAVTLQAADVTGVGGALLASPTFTGTPAAPTATAGTNTTQIATTAFVVASYAPLASPTFTGTPLSTTPTAGDSSTKIATTAFVATSYAPLASPSFTGRVQAPAASFTVSALGSISGTQTLDLGAASEWTMTIAGATTIAFTNTLGANLSEVVYIRFTNAGSAAITWPASTKFAGASAPVFTASGIDLVGVKYDTTTSTYMVFVVGLAIG